MGMKSIKFLQLNSSTKKEQEQKFDADTNAAIHYIISIAIKMLN
ncbi:Cysteine--tRNA ligase [Rickettsia prowazekii str. GvF12]|nr:Cysteine--tRNA ligase [Rickettsia prowazekii str. GvF12]